MTSNAIKIILKFVFALALIYWLVSSGKLNFEILREAMRDPLRIAGGFGMLLMVAMIVAWRWKFILEARLDHKLNFYQLAKCNWIGLFFNTVLPGSVTGDFVKIVYIKEQDAKLTTKYLLGSVVLDRVVGLFGLILMVGLFSLVNYSELTQLSAHVKQLININLLLFAGVIFGLFSLYFFESIPRKILQQMEHIKVIHNIGTKLLKIWDELCLIRKRLIVVTLVSILIHVGAVFTFWFLAAPFAQGAQFQLHHAFSFVPIGFVTVAIPIAPAGLGVGHAVFHALFKFFGISNGASLFNIFFFVQISVYLLGAIPYLFGRSIRIKEIDGHKLNTESN